MHNSIITSIVPVLPSGNIERDVSWYSQQTGFEKLWADNMYAILRRGEFTMHLQWHAGTQEDPLNGGSVVRIFVNDIRQIFDEFVDRNTVEKDKLNMNTPWGTHEFGFFDLNQNAIFVVSDSSR